MQFGSDLIYKFNSFISSKNTKTPSYLTQNKKLDNQVLINILQNFFQIKSDIFDKLVLDNLVSNILI